MKYFVIFTALVFLVIMMYIDIAILFVGEKYRIGAPVIPILLIANLCLGMYYNHSIWYKITNNTKFGAYLSLFGAFITVVLNVYWIPRIGYIGSAWATLICYASMVVASYFIGQKHFPVNYDLKRIIGYISIVIIFYLLSTYIRNIIDNQFIKTAINTAFIIIYLIMVYILEKPYFIKQKTNNNESRNY